MGCGVGSEMPGLTVEIGRVISVIEQRPGVVELSVEIPGRAAPEKAILYPALCHETVEPGDRVLLNTTAVRLGLGSGGYHIVVARLQQAGNPDERQITAMPLEQAPGMKGALGTRTPSEKGISKDQPIRNQAGHILKLRYTPLQVRCLAVEEAASPHHAALAEAESITGMPVVVASLHSQVAAIAAGIKAQTGGKAKIAYIMTDTAALAIGFSRLVGELKEKGLVEVTITAGQAFGGDLEAVNVYSALLAAKIAAGADLAIVAQGPGNVGTDTLFGFGAIYQGEVVNAVGVLGGIPLAAVRLSYADSRPRHQGISQQFLVSLGRVALQRAVVVLPKLEEAKLSLLQKQLREAGIFARHEVVIEEGEAGLGELARLGMRLSTMGRGLEQDREFFLAAAAAGIAAAKRLINSRG